MTKLRIKTPEGVVFSYTVASPITRFLAWAVDCAVIVAFSSFISTCTTILGAVSFDFARALGIASYFAISIGYGIFLEWHWRGQTLGKRMLRLRVIDREGLRLRIDQIAIRNLLRAVDLMPGLYLLGGIAALASTYSQRLGDMAANTIVVRMPKIRVPDLDQLVAGKFNSLRQFPVLEARLRQLLSPIEADALLEALLRRDEIEPHERLTLFAELAGRCRELVHFPPEVDELMADEQYVRNVVDIVYR